MQSRIIIYTHTQSSRLNYVLNWIFDEVLQVAHEIRREISESESTHIAYGERVPGAMYIPQETGIAEGSKIDGHVNWLQSIAPDLQEWEFDLFTAIFFLLSRMEEYECDATDQHGRFPAAASFQDKNGVLPDPLIDRWVECLRLYLNKTYGLQIPLPAFRLMPSYDIDMVWSYKNKGLKRDLGGLLKSIGKLSVSETRARWGVLTDKVNDPYFSFEKIFKLHKETGLSALFFWLLPASVSAFDKQNSRDHPALRQLIQEAKMLGFDSGIHPSYHAVAQDLFSEEKTFLEEILQETTYKSRQHYLHMHLPDTYRYLLKNGISEDYTMGYAGKMGFRAGTGRPFLWYDLENEKVTGLRVHPFVFMDASARFYEQLNPENAYSKLAAIRKDLERYGSTLCLIHHNFALGTDPEWSGWWEGYQRFIRS